MRLAPGVIMRLYDTGTRPESLKRHVCICPERRVFLRINSSPEWEPCFVLRPSDCEGGVEHESYVELANPYHPTAGRMREDWGRPANRLGRLAGSAARNLALAARRAVTLTPDIQELIWENLAGR